MNSKPLQDDECSGGGAGHKRDARGKKIPNLKDVQTIQRSWRFSFKYMTTHRIVDDYFKNGPTIEHVKSISFEALVVLLKEKPIIAVTKATLQRIHLLSIFLHGSPSKTLAPENVNARVFLAAFMIAYRPTHVFESMGTLEQALLESSIPLLETFEKIGKALLSTKGKCFAEVDKDLTKDFPAMLFEYLKRFKAWKVPDEAKLSCRIKHALIALYQAEEHLPPDEPEDSKLKVEFRIQIERLRNKLLQIAGADALKQFDEQRLSGKGGCDSCQSDAVASRVRRDGGGGAYAALPGRMTNEQLAHELHLDPTFQLDEHGGHSVENPVFHRIRESFHQAFWDSLVDDLKLASPCYVRVLRVLGEIRDGVNDLCGSRESGNISEAVDLEFIKQQAERGLYEWDSCKRLIAAIVEVIQRVQAPKRDDETKAKWTQVKKSMDEAEVGEQPCKFCKALEFLLDRVNAMRIDAANARLRLIAPVIRDHGLEYERGKFQDKLNDGSLTDERTRAWIAKTIETEVKSRQMDLQRLLRGEASAFREIHTAAMLSLIADGCVPRPENSPETHLFDVYRLATLQAEFEYIVMAITMLITAENYLMGSTSRAITATDAVVLEHVAMQFVSESRRSIDVDETVSDLCRTLERSTLSEEMKTKMPVVLLQCAMSTDTVHSIVRKRIRNLFLRIVKEGKVPDNIGLTRKSTVMVPRIDKAATKLRNVANLNRNVHVDRYNLIILEEAQKFRDRPPTDESNSP